MALTVIDANDSNAGEARIVVGVIGTIVSFFSIAFAADLTLACCFWFLISIIITVSGFDAKKKAANMQQVVYIPEPKQVQQVIHHLYPQPPVVQPRLAPVHISKTSTHNSPATSQEDWAMDARNLEMARDWEKAAQAYQKAGLYAEAGRIRKKHMEKDDSGVNIQIQGGDTIHDSVVMRDDSSQL
ncbi:MAG: hypothetical protein QF440_01580 [Candidatus Thalassarchaeaceae archaeon]|jgi:hypothetical protein|nr:hypothetical protein [Candidatus Thalassarchaeaceae archaeon]